jgi:hypothetical protein
MKVLFIFAITGKCLCKKAMLITRIYSGIVSVNAADSKCSACSKFVDHFDVLLTSSTWKKSVQRALIDKCKKKPIAESIKVNKCDELFYCTNSVSSDSDNLFQ